MFVSKEIGSYSLNPFDEIAKGNFLVTAGNENGFNTMTAGWGAFGVMWYKNIAVAVIRPTRYTKEFVDREDYFSLCFFDSDRQDVLRFCGSHSGRDTDKCKGAGITPVFDKQAPYFAEAKRVVICKKIYVGKIEENNFTDPAIEQKWYPEKDHHSVYVGEIIDISERE